MISDPFVSERWRPVLDELARWAREGAAADLWLRDDDAVEVTPALRRLANLCDRHRVPCLIAVIPAHATRELARFIADQQFLDVATHGYAHRNHAPAGVKSQEFPDTRSTAEIHDELGRGVALMEGLFGAKLAPVYVPPWNRIGADVAALLPRHGFSAVSAFGRRSLFAGTPPLREINTHIDIIDWRGTRGGRDMAALIADLARELAWARENGRAATGILTHHLVHDAAAWQFLDELLAVTYTHDAVRWRTVAEFLDSQ